MALRKKSMFSAAVLIGSLLSRRHQAHGARQSETVCRLSTRLVIVDLDDVKHRHIIDHALDARLRREADERNAVVLRQLADADIGQ